MVQILEWLHHWVEKRLTSKQLKKRLDGVWDYPPIAESLWGAGIEEIEVYIGRRQNMVDQFILNWTIMDLCLKVERRPGDMFGK